MVARSKSMSMSDGLRLALFAAGIWVHAQSLGLAPLPAQYRFHLAVSPQSRRCKIC